MNSKFNIKNIASIKGHLLNSGRLVQDLNNLRRKVDVSNYDEIVRFLCSVTKLNKQIYYNSYPRTIEHIRLRNVFNPVSLERELLWAASYLMQHKSNLNNYVRLSESFNDGMLRGDYELCEQCLDTIEKDFGISYWLIKNRIAYLQIAKGLEAQKKYSTSIKIKMGSQSPTVFFAHYISYRNEPTVSYFTHSNSVDDILSRSLGDLFLLPFFQYHFAAHRIFNDSELSSILALSGTLSVIDCYESFIFVVKSVVAGRITEASRLGLSLTESFLESLVLKVNGFLQSSVLYALRDELRCDDKKLLISETQLAYLYGQKNLAMEFAQTEFAEDSNNISLLITIARILSVGNAAELAEINFLKKGIAFEIIKRLISVLKVDEDFENSLISLLNLTTNFYGYTWADCLFGFIVNFVTHESSHEDFYFVNYGAVGMLHNDLYRVWFYTKSINKLKYYHCVTNDQSDLVKEALAMICNKNVGYSFSDVDKAELNFSKMINAFMKQEYVDGMTFASLLVDEEDKLIRNTSIRMSCSFLLSQDMVDECIEFIVSKYMINEKLISYMPIKEVGDFLAAKRFRTNNSLLLAIFLDIYKTSFGNDFERRKKYAYEDFLKKNLISKPSELGPLLSHYKLEDVVYFLKNVCTEDLFSKSVTFRSSQDVVKERLQVCKLLIEIDGSRSTIYQNEVKDIQKKIMVRKRIKEIEKTKIYVNYSQLKLVVSKSVKDKYARYISLIKEGIDSEYFAKMQIQVEATYNKLPKEFDAEIYRDTLLSLDLPENETYSLFESIISDLRDLFVSNTEYGLDGYLSTRIRHGTLSSQIRSVLELSNLITQRTKTADKFHYQDNEYWSAELGITDVNVEKDLKFFLSDFSKKFDSIIQKILSEWVQIKKNPDEKGIFDFVLNRQGIIIMSTFVVSTTPFDEFVEEVFRQLYNVLEEALDALRDKIVKEIKPEINTIVDELLKRINNTSGINGIGLLNTAINRARSEVQVSVDRVTEWFRLSREFANEPFTIEDSLTISVDSIITLYPDFSAKISVDDYANEVIINGQYLASYVDVFFILLENIIKHSGFFGQSAAVISCVLERGSIVVSITNDIATPEIASQSKVRLVKIKEYIDRNMSKEYASIEGGSGFFKIQKTLQYDIPSGSDGGSPILSFSVNSQQFSVKVGFPLA